MDLQRESQYDLVIEANSLMSLSDRGWQVKEGPKYQTFAGKKSIVVAAVGLANKGKTFIINKLVSRNFPSGYHVKTEGLSMILADESGKVEVKDWAEYYENKINDRLATENFLQTFILQECNVILLTVSQLTQSDQKLVERILNRFSHKKVVIIHNLHEIVTKKDAEKFIKSDILEAFKVTEQDASTNLKDCNKKIWVTPPRDPKRSPIRHLVMARDGTEAGDYYNPFVFEHLNHVLLTDATYTEFNLPKRLSNYTEMRLTHYCMIKSKNTGSETSSATPGTLTSVKYDADRKAIVMASPVELTCKAVYFDAGGNLWKTESPNEYEPVHTVVDHPERVDVWVDLPGKFEGLTWTIVGLGAKQMLHIKGERRTTGQVDKNKDKILSNNRKAGKIELLIEVLPFETCTLQVNGKNMKYENGVALFTLSKTSHEEGEEESISFA
eukprot:TRINITY_DN217_c0_g1_i1.p1 TRINITY_DN217_c0_g1~~TRINITY_DN217_c0_g1_i1.p1  ORF type:complete len:441 (-),score=87.12 TRINITY_DN217_c0_g1_i1:230-1552(-)